MTNNDDALSFLDYYLSDEHESDSAVMLEGPWGIGKTYFVKEYLKSRQASIQTTDKPGKRRYLYASLYGVRTTAEITAQFFSQAHPKLNSKAARLLGSLASRVINGFAGTDVNSQQENQAILEGLVLNLEDQILVFDDLERCAMPLSDVMGFINAYVEHEGMKVIVIASESDMPEDSQKAEYLNKKEKLIGKTLRVGSDPRTVLQEFLKKIKDPIVVSTIKIEQEQLLRVFTSSEAHNFRSLRSALTDFERLVSLVDSKLKTSPVAMSRLLMYLVATELEFRCGNLKHSDFENLTNFLKFQLLDRLNKEKSSPQFLRIEKLQSTYSDVIWDDPIVPPECLGQLFSAGSFDVEVVNKHLNNHPIIIGYEATPAWRQLWDWTSLDISHYHVAREKLIDEIRNHEITHPGIILHAAGIFISLSTYDDNLLGSRVDILKYFERYFQKLLRQGRLEPALDVFDRLYGTTGYGGLGFSGGDSPLLKKIVLIARDATSLAFEEKMKALAPQLLSRIQENLNDCQFLNQFGHNEGNYGGTPILHFVKVKDFADVLIQDYHPNDHLFAVLKTRYQSERLNNNLENEYDWLRKLRKELERRANKAFPPYKTLLKLRIDSCFDAIEKETSSIESAATK